MIAQGPLTLRRAFDSLCAEQPLACSTRKLRAYQLRRWERLTDDPDIRAISTETFEAYRRIRVAAGHSPESAETDINFVMRVLRVAFDQGLVARLPRRGRRLKGQPHKTARISLVDFDRFLAAIPDARLAVARKNGPARGRMVASQLPDWARAFWGTAYFSCLRLGNLLALEWEQFGADALEVRQLKTGNLLSIPVHPVWRRLLSALPGAWTTGRIFRISRKTLYRDQRAIAAVAGLRSITPQSVRKLGARCYERAHAGSGRLILGRPLPGADGYYLDVPEILQMASEKLAVPASLLTPEERELDRLGEGLLLENFRRLRAEDRQAVLRMVSSLRRGLAGLI